jgi:hydroxyethylthiazole kinase-like uncharacterized protein yjeF
MSDSAERKYGALDSAQVAALDAAATAAGVDVIQLMEVAGWQVARCAWHMLDQRPARVGVVAGRGNNGGDGLVAARHLAAWGCRVRAVVIAGEGQLRELAGHQLHAALGAGVDASVSTQPEALTAAIDGADLVLDALLGTGLTSPPREPDAGAIRALAGYQLLSIDVPSGLDAGSGEAHDPCVEATVTCTLTAMKRGLWSKRAREHAGEVMVADIGMPATAWAACGLQAPSAVRGGALLRVAAIH